MLHIEVPTMPPDALTLDPPSTDAVGTDLTPPAPPAPIAIPDGDPAAAALALLHAARPDAAATLRGRSAGIGAALADLVEQGRE